MSKKSSQKIIDNARNWAKKNPQIRALILTGSRACGNEDDLSDYDFMVFCKNTSLVLKDHKWFASIGKLWLSLPEKVSYHGKIYPTRLCIFEEGKNVDFTFFSLDVLRSLLKKGTFLDAKTKVLVDKEGSTKSLKDPSIADLKIKKPSQKTFTLLVEEFWFEAYQIAKYIKRGDLWPAKFRDADVKHRLLLKMIEWNEAAKLNWKFISRPTGKRMQSWISKSTWEEIQKIFCHFDQKECWKALFQMMALFRKLAIETATKSDFTYLYEIDRQVSDYIRKLTSPPR